MPAKWNSINGISSFAGILKGKPTEPEFESLGKGRWRISQSDVDQVLAAELRKQVGIVHPYIIVDSSQGFHVVEAGGDGGWMGEVLAKLQWRKQDGRWYLAEAVHSVNGKPYISWEITKISFDARDCRRQFGAMESVVPFGTEVRIQDARLRPLEVRYKGGAAGEDEHQLRTLALLKHKKANK